MAEPSCWALRAQLGRPGGSQWFSIHLDETGSSVTLLPRVTIAIAGRSDQFGCRCLLQAISPPSLPAAHILGLTNDPQKCSTYLSVDPEVMHGGFSRFAAFSPILQTSFVGQRLINRLPLYSPSVRGLSTFADSVESDQLQGSTASLKS